MAKPSGLLTTYIALLRGINVGGKNKLPMKDLCALFTDRGSTNVRNYIQSGNIVFQAKSSQIERISNGVRARITDDFGYDIPLVIRTADEIIRVATGNPYDTKSESDFLHVMFLADEPSREMVSALDPNRSSPDAFQVRGRDIYLRCPNGVAKTKLTNAYFDSKLKTVSTGRNWRTVLKLVEMAEE